MKNKNDFLPLIMFAPFIAMTIMNSKGINLRWLGIVGIFLTIITINIFLEKSRKNRSNRLEEKSSGKGLHILKFIIFIGVPISILLSLLIISKAEIISLIIFLIIPVNMMFGWIGYDDWKKCKNIYLSVKYKTNID